MSDYYKLLTILSFVHFVVSFRNQRKTYWIKQFLQLNFLFDPQTGADLFLLYFHLNWNSVASALCIWHLSCQFSNIHVTDAIFVATVKMLLQCAILLPFSFRRLPLAHKGELLQPANFYFIHFRNSTIEQNFKCEAFAFRPIRCTVISWRIP